MKIVQDFGASMAGEITIAGLSILCFLWAGYAFWRTRSDIKAKKDRQESWLFRLNLFLNSIRIKKASEIAQELLVLMKTPTQTDAPEELKVIDAFDFSVSTHEREQFSKEHAFHEKEREVMEIFTRMRSLSTYVNDALLELAPSLDLSAAEQIMATFIERTSVRDTPPEMETFKASHFKPHNKWSELYEEEDQTDYMLVPQSLYGSTYQRLAFYPGHVYLLSLKLNQAVQSAAVKMAYMYQHFYLPVGEATAECKASLPIAVERIDDEVLLMLKADRNTVFEQAIYRAAGFLNIELRVGDRIILISDRPAFMRLGIDMSDVRHDTLVNELVNITNHAQANGFVTARWAEDDKEIVWFLNAKPYTMEELYSNA